MLKQLFDPYVLSKVTQFYKTLFHPIGTACTLVYTPVYYLAFYCIKTHFGGPKTFNQVIQITLP